MSRRAAIIEDVFDDDTDLPLPNAPLPNTGARGPLLQELNIPYEDVDYSQPVPSPSSFPQMQQQQQQQKNVAASASGGGLGQTMRETNTVTDMTPYKKWSCIYPIYIDAKRPYGAGVRRLPRQKSVWWPLSKDIADAATRLGLKALHEVNKSHPRDWENPGRVRIQWKLEGRLVNPQIKTKRQLLEKIATYIQYSKPESKPIPPYTSPPSPEESSPNLPAITSSTTKGKQPLSSSKPPPSSKAKSSIISPKPPSSQTQSQKKSRRHCPSPPHPHPSLSERASAYSPALESGMLIDAVKAGMTAQEGQPGAGGPGADGAAGGAPGQGGGNFHQKGKRKVVRVRG